MKKLLKDLPLPITGLMLGFAALGNLVQTYSQDIRNIFGTISFIIFILVVLKMLLFSEGVKEALENPLVASVFPTFSMTMMLLATYIKPFSDGIAGVFWFAGLILHMILMIGFTQKFVLNDNYSIKKVFPSWFIPYVGIAVASVTSGVFGMQSIGKVLFLFALIAFIVLLPIVLKRILVVKDMPEATIPSIAILSAPASLCLAGYINSFEVKNTVLVYILLLVAQILYWGVIFYLSRMLRLPFYPSYSGFTFPLVISGLALKLANGFLVSSGHSMPLFIKLIFIEEVIAALACIYVLIRFIGFLFAREGATEMEKRA
ncbi:MAG: TDT family transporter [Tissierellia bacterium]|nr:TDT family transporter [Tissierellia bacterium]